MPEASAVGASALEKRGHVLHVGRVDRATVEVMQGEDATHEIRSRASNGPSKVA